MSLFCPSCHNFLLLSESSANKAFSCRSCPYTFLITNSVSHKFEFPQLEITDIKRLEKEQSKLDKIIATCRECGNNECYSWNLKLSDSDTQETCFFRCINCYAFWKNS